jgi:hypothetical protein
MAMANGWLTPSPDPSLSASRVFNGPLVPSTLYELLGGDILTMNLNASIAGASPRFSLAAYELKAEHPTVDAAWTVLDAANDLADHEVVEACRRVIDASLSGRQALQADMQLVSNYFR